MDHCAQDMTMKQVPVISIEIKNGICHSLANLLLCLIMIINKPNDYYLLYSVETLHAMHHI